MDHPLVLLLEALQLVGNLGARRMFGPCSFLRAASRLLGTQPLDLATESRGLVLGVGAGAGLLVEPLVFGGKDPARFFGRAVVPPGGSLELGQSRPERPPTRLRRLRDGDRVDAEHGRRGGRPLGAFPLREKLVQEQSRSPRARRRLGDDVRRPVNS